MSGNNLYAVHDSVIHTLYTEGESQTQISRTLDIPLSAVRSRLSSMGFIEKNRVDGTTDLDRALDEYEMLTIERGLNGGYVVTIEDATGEEKQTLIAAIRSAMDGKQAIDKITHLRRKR